MSRRRKAEPLATIARKPFSARLWPRSLAFRVVAFSTIWAILTLVVIFTLITTLYRQASERGFDSLLSAHLFNLIGSVGVSEAGQLTGAPDLGDLRFSQPNSGWYWSVEPASEGVHGELHSSSMTKAIPSAQGTRLLWAAPADSFTFIDANLNMQKPAGVTDGSVALTPAFTLQDQ